MLDLSIIIPVYNQEKYICECLDSIVAKQKNINYEIILVDDGSTDGTLDILEAYQKLYTSKIKIVKRNRVGAGACRNFGLSVATGNYIHFLDADDFLEANAYELALACIRQNNADICLFNHYKYDNITKLKTKREYKNLPSSGALFSFNNYSPVLLNANTNVVPWNKIYNRTYLQKNNFKFDEIMCANDRTFYFATITNCVRITFCNEVLINYRINNPESLVGAGRKKHFANHLEAFKNSRVVMLNKSLNIYRAFLNCSMTDIAVFYTKLTPEERKNNLSAIQQFVSTIEKDFNITNIIPNQFSWFNTWLALKNQTSSVPVVLACDNKYAPYAGAAIQSLKEHINKSLEYNIYVFHTVLTTNTTTKLESISEGNFHVKCVDVSDYIKNLNLYARSRFTVEMYYRLIIPYVLAEDNKAVYIDCDIICEDDIAKLYNMVQFTNNELLAGVKNIWENEKSFYGAKKLGFTMDGDYINSGVLVLNNKLLREESTLDSFKEFIETHRDLILPDQDTINMVCRNRIKILDYYWNFQESCIKLPNFNKYLSEGIGLIHYTTGRKPWKANKESVLFTDNFWKYANKSVFSEEILTAYTASTTNKTAANNTSAIQQKANQISTKQTSLNVKATLSQKSKIAVCAIVKNENKYLREWVTHYYNLGFSKIFLFDNNDINGESPKYAIADFITAGFVEIIDARGKANAQVSSYNWLYHSDKLANFVWIAFLDLDEFLTLDNNQNISEFLAQDKFKNFNCIAINWRYFDDNNLITIKNNNYEVLNRFTHEFKDKHSRAGMIPSSFAGVSKRIVRTNLKDIIINSSHGPIDSTSSGESDSESGANRFIIKACNARGKALAKNRIMSVPDWTYDGACLHHYSYKTLEEFVQIKLKRGYPTKYKNGGKNLNLVDFFKVNELTGEKLAWLDTHNIQYDLDALITANKIYLNPPEKKVLIEQKELYLHPRTESQNSTDTTAPGWAGREGYYLTF